MTSRPNEAAKDRSMNKEKLKNLVGYRIRIRPVARRPGASDELPVADDDWIIGNVDMDRVELTNVRTGHNAVLGLDHIHSFLSDPARDNTGVKYGFLQLRVQLSLLPQGLDIEPLAPGEWGMPTPIFRAKGAGQVMPLAATRLQELMTKLFKTTQLLNRDEVAEMVYLMGELDGISGNIVRDKKSLFLYQQQQFPDGTMSVEVWMYKSPDGTLKPIYAAKAWEASERSRRSELSAEDLALLDGLIQGFRRLRAENLKMVIKDVPEFNDANDQK